MVGLQVGRIDRQLIRPAALCGERLEDAVEHAEPVPADERVVDRLGRPVLDRRVILAQAVANDEDDAADNATIIHPRHAMR